MITKRKIHIALSWILVIICMGIIFSLSAQVADDSQELSDSFIRKIFEAFGITMKSGLIRTIAHCLEFMGLSLLLFNAIYVTWKIKATPLIAFLSTVVYAISDEIHQYFVPGRAFQFVDISIDSCGALIGVIVSMVILKIIFYIKKRGNQDGNSQTI